jgi:hypothetical protein
MKLSLDTLHHHTTEEGDCMLWKHGTNSYGYPLARIDGITVNVRKWVFEQAGKTMKNRHVIATRCGNRTCLNPDHLICVTRSSSNAAAYRTGRRNVASETAARRQSAALQGGIWTPKLNLEKARAIRAMKGGSRSQQSIADEYGISRSTVGEIWSGRRWRESSYSVFTWAQQA